MVYISIEWDRMSTCEGASSCCYQSIFDLTHPVLSNAGSTLHCRSLEMALLGATTSHKTMTNTNLWFTTNILNRYKVLLHLSYFLIKLSNPLWKCFHFSWLHTKYFDRKSLLCYFLKCCFFPWNILKRNWRFLSEEKIKWSFREL